MPIRPEKRTMSFGSALITCILFAATAAGCQTNASAGGYPAEISASQAQTEIAGGALVLDVREPAEYAEGHIPGSILIPLGSLSARTGELPKGPPIIVVCRTGNRSAEGRDILLGKGFPKVTSLAGGIYSWMSAGYFLQSN